MRLVKLTDVKWERLSEGLERRYVSGERMTLAQLRIKRGSVVRLHSHPNEQISLVLEGRLEFRSGGRRLVASAGDLVIIPPNLEHEVEALDDSLVVDVFSPPRDDWARGEDKYLRG